MGSINTPNESDDIVKYVSALLDKSEEAYLMALEIINKPTIKYRSEGFCFFICNAWELALKAFIIKRQNDISAIDIKHNPSQTIGLEQCIEKVLTSQTNSVKLNLNMIRQIRNKATHNVLPEYDFKFAPLFQACIFNLVEFFKKHFSEHELNSQITAFVMLSNLPENANSPLSLNPKALMQLTAMTEEVDSKDISGEITLTVKLVSTKKADDADVRYSISKDADEKVRFIEKPKDVNITHPFIQTEVLKKVRESLMLSDNSDFGINKHSIQKFIRENEIKKKPEYCYPLKQGEQSELYTYRYSQKLVDFIVYEFEQEKKAKKD